MPLWQADKGPKEAIFPPSRASLKLKLKIQYPNPHPRLNWANHRCNLYAQSHLVEAQYLTETGPELRIVVTSVSSPTSLVAVPS